MSPVPKKPATTKTTASSCVLGLSARLVPLVVVLVNFILQGLEVLENRNLDEGPRRQSNNH